LVYLSSRGREKFSVFTKKYVGRRAAMLVDKELVSAPLINSQITEGKLIIMGFFTHKEALSISKGIIPKN